MKDNEKLNALRSHSNFNKEDYPYAAYLPFWAFKKGMRVIEEDDCDAPKTIYFMCVLSEDVFKDKTEDNGTILDCYVLHKIAYASDGTVIYDWILKPCVSHDETFESFPRRSILFFG